MKRRNIYDKIGIKDERLDDSIETIRAVGEFQCGGDNPLDVFLKSEAFKYNRDGYGNTYLVKNDKNEIIAYYTLKANGIQMQNSEGTVDSVSSIELARFAVDHKFQSKGYGRLIFTYMIMPKIIEVSEIVGVNTVIVFVDEYNKHGIRFYHRLGFGLANDRIKNYIEEEFSKKCNIMYVSMEACLVYYNNAIKCFDIN